MNPGPSPEPDTLLADPLYPRLKGYMIESTGLAYYEDKDADLARRIGRRMSDKGLRDCASYIELLSDPARGPTEMDALVGEVTIGETYFFRHREHFEALRDIVLPELIARAPAHVPATQRLRIWCAGCADGAEPYSLAILLRRELAHRLAGWEVSILGTDINRRCLEIAREGRYEPWSLRATAEELRRDCFEQQGKQWLIAPEYKVGVTFQYHNLAEDLLPPLLNGAFDLIICRNVMIYFDPRLMRRIVRRFHDCLSPQGWLLVGPSEPNMTHFTSFRVVNAPGVTLFQKPDREERNLPEAIAPAVPLTGPMPLAPPVSVLPPPPAVETPAIARVLDRSVPTLADLRQRADQGDWEDAARCGKQLIEADNLNAPAHFHYALILEQLGNHVESERSLRRAIYLDRQAVLAHYHLGLMLRSRGEARQAERCFQNTLDLLTAMAGDETLADADGITAIELRKLVLKQMENLKERV